VKICVGSKNPVKLVSVENAIRKIWPDARIISVEADSKVSQQPTSNEEAIRGAIARAEFKAQIIVLNHQVLLPWIILRCSMYILHKSHADLELLRRNWIQLQVQQKKRTQIRNKQFQC